MAGPLLGTFLGWGVCETRGGRESGEGEVDLQEVEVGGEGGEDREGVSEGEGEREWERERNRHRDRDNAAHAATAGRFTLSCSVPMHHPYLT